MDQCPIESTKTQRVYYSVQGFEHPALFHVGKMGTDLVQSLARPSTIGVIIDPLVTLGNAFFPLADLFIPPVTILDITLACCLMHGGFVSILIVGGCRC